MRDFEAEELDPDLGDVSSGVELDIEIVDGTWTVAGVQFMKLSKTAVSFPLSDSMLSSLAGWFSIGAKGVDVKGVDAKEVDDESSGL